MINRDLTPDEVESLLDETSPSATSNSRRPQADPHPAMLTSSLFVTSMNHDDTPCDKPNPSAGLSSGASQDKSIPASMSLDVTQSLVDILRTAVERTISAWTAALRQPLRTILEMEIEEVQAFHSGLASQYELPGCIQMMRAAPADESIFLQLDRVVVFGMIDRLLGGGKSPTPNVRRGLTEIESSLLMRITAGLIKGLERQFSPDDPQSISTERIESNPQSLPSQQHSHYQVRIRTAWEQHSGHIRLIFPESLLASLSNSKSVEADVSDQLPDDAVSVVAGQVRMPRQDALALEVGDELVLPKPPARIYVDRKRMYAGKLGSAGNNKAVRVEGSLES